ncbi:MAG: hypothetical protein NC347_07310 [Clostridium sp.]|nr:hypothetical protein [Clostridium sp.]
MILVDKDIKKYVADKKLIISDYQEKNVNCISYDLTLDYIIDKDKEEHREYNLYPGETVFVCTKEKLSIPDNMMGRIAEKNSRMRQGLIVNGPHYHPGHVTYAFLRVQNISTDIICLEQGMSIAQIIFEQLTQTPEVPYREKKDASFADEVTYRGLGNYKEEYERQSKAVVNKTKEDIENLSQKIYANVLTIMGVLVAIFSLITINYQAFTNSVLTAGHIVAMNLTLALCIVILMGIILIFVNHAKNKKFLFAYIVILVILAVATGILSVTLF